jgi:ferredoxin
MTTQPHDEIDRSDTNRSGFEPVLGSTFEPDESGRSGFEPELGGVVRQKFVYVDEATCIGCRFCAHVANNTFYIEPDYGRSRAIRQDGDPEDLIQEAIDTCPVNCIYWVNHRELTDLEEARQDQILAPVGFPVERSLVRPKVKRKPQ